MSHLRLAVFDVDGTLVDSQHNIVSAMGQAFRANGFELPGADAVRRLIGLHLVDAVAALLPLADRDLHVRVANSYKEAFRAMRMVRDDMDPLFPGVLECLDALEREGWLLALATGKSRKGVEAMLERHDLEDRFATIQTVDDNPGKPDPSMLLRAAAECGVEPERTVMIGDTTYDMMMAVAARTAAVGVAWGNHRTDELREAGAQAILESFDNVCHVCHRVMGDRQCA